MTFEEVNKVLIYEDGKVSKKEITEHPDVQYCKVVEWDGQQIILPNPFYATFSEDIDFEQGAIIAADEASLIMVLNRHYNEALAKAKQIRRALKELSGVKV